MRLAMWSGPRNISTAMMRAWENRPDCTVVDEPLYAAYLAATGLDHPARDEVIAAGETDPMRVAAWLTGPIPEGKPIWYQKHMTHHLLPGMDLGWVHRGLSHVFLIRSPEAVVDSYLKSRSTITPEDIGLLQQVELFDAVCAQQAAAPPVIDADDFLKAPEAHLRCLCELLGIAFSERMLHWPAGPRASDGVWAPHWYAAVWRSTGFEPWRERRPQLDNHGRAVAAVCRPAYERLHALRLMA